MSHEFHVENVQSVLGKMVDTEPRKLKIVWMVSVVHMFYFTFVLYCCYFCSCVWYLNPILDIFCLLLFSVQLFGINSLCLSYVWLQFECICTTSHHFENFTVATMTWLTVKACLCHKTTIRSIPRSSLVTRYVTTLTRPVLLVERKLLIRPEHFSLLRFERGSLCLIFRFQCSILYIIVSWSFSFGHCNVSHSIYNFWLRLCYLQTFRSWTLSYPVLI